RDFHVTGVQTCALPIYEIYASPAISNGRVFFVTRDRTICIADPTAEVASDEIPPLAEEAELQDEVASIQLIPYEATVDAGGSIRSEERRVRTGRRWPWP